MSSLPTVILAFLQAFGFAVVIVGGLAGLGWLITRYMNPLR